MSQTNFQFSPRIKLIFENLDTVRELLKVCRGKGELEDELNRFTKSIHNVLIVLIPKLAAWKCDFYSDSIYFYPDSSWKLQTNDRMAICFSNFTLETLGDPGVGLYVPKKWEPRKEFIEQLYEGLPSNLNDYRYNEVEWPLWKDIRVATFNTTEDFGTLANNIKTHLELLLNIEPDIKAILKSVNKKNK
jgi:hypothetical protein